MRNLKKVVALVAVFAMLVSSVAFGQTFSDVAEDANYYEAIEMLNGLNILTGDDQDGDGVMDFRPEDTITRAEVAAVISRIQGINSAAQTDTVFTDVTASHWASGYVAQAAGQGIVNGYGDGTFGPENPVLYEQAVKMIVETLGYAPFVEENGGYYAGHMTAASRYGVLEGVVGGTIGKEATRGQVAQMLYNAVDTPLMERASYGDEASYVIYNGFSSSAANYVTLLKRDLKVKKFEGILTVNSVTSYTAANPIDTEKEAQVKITPTAGADVNAYYEVNEIKTWLVGESDANDYIGKSVTGYAKSTGISGRYEIIAISETSLNDEVSFTFDQFADITGDGSSTPYTIEYYTDKDNGIKTSVKVELATAEDVNDEAVLYNGAAISGKTLADYIGTGKIVDVNSQYSGMVTLIDNDTTAGYDVVKIDAAVTAVVDEVSSRGKIAFKNAPVNNLVSGQSYSKLNIIFDQDVTDEVIMLTKNGEAMDWTELKEWDVISAIWNPTTKVYSLDVLDSSVVEGKVAQTKSSLTSAGGTAYVIDGVEYDVAANAYNAGSLRLGAAGLFYIDAFGKIVAYDKNGVASASDNYAYVLAATKTTDDWGKENVRVQLLAKDGNVYEAYLASEVELNNYATLGSIATFFSGTYDAGSDIFEVEDFVASTGATAFAAAIQNELVVYEANAAGEIDTLGFYTTDDETAETNGWLYRAAYSTSGNDFDEEDMELTAGGKYNITEDTLVFYINGTNTLSYSLENVVDGGGNVTTDNTASKTGSKVAAATSIGSVGATTPIAVFDVDNNDDAAVVVIYNMIGGISANTNVAVIDAVGDAVVDGDKVKVVEFFMGGEKRTAYTDVNINATQKSAIAGLTQGDVIKFAFNADGTVITAATAVLVDYDDVLTGNSGSGWYSTGAQFSADGTTPFIVSASGAAAAGPVIKYNSATKKLTLGTEDNSGNPLGSPVTYDSWTEAAGIKAANANVYVYEPSKLANRLYVGDASDANVDAEIIERQKEDAIKVTKNGVTTTIVAANKSEIGLLDYAVSFVNADGDVIDVVIYKPADFGSYYVD